MITFKKEFVRSFVMKQINNLFYKITCAILIFFFACVFLQTTGNLSHMEIFSTAWTGLWKPLFLLSGAALLLLVILGLLKLLNSISAKRKTAVLIALGCIGIALQLALIFGVRPILQYDALKPVDTAMSLLKGLPLASSEYYDYFSIYPHNLPLTLYIFCIFKAAQAVGIAEADYILVLQLLNVLLLDFALVQLYRLIKMRAGKNASLGYALLCFLNPLLYYYPVFFYTQVLSIPIFVLMITLFFQILDADTLKKQIFYGACYGMVLFFGWKIRFFTLITLISCAMYLWFHNGRSRLSGKAVAITALSALLMFTCCAGVNHALMEKYSLSTEEEKAFPIQHWIMMGLQGDGTFYYVDEDFTKAIPTKEERAAANTEMIRERVEDLGFAGLLQLWGRKLSITWADGFDDYASNLTLVRHYSSVNDWLSGYLAEFPAAYLHIYNCMSWLLLTLCAVKLFQRKLSDFAYVICITILGGMMFHLIWEAGEQYSMPFALLMIAGASMGLDTLSLPSVRRVFTKKRLTAVCASSAAAMAASIVCLIFSLTGKAFEVTEIGTIQNLVAGDYIYLENGQTLTQTVTCSRAFNTLTLRYKYYDDTEGEAIITLRLLDSGGRCITEEVLPLENIIIIENFSFPEVTPDGSETYTIELVGTKIPDGSRGGFTAYHTGFWDTYPEGEAALDGATVENSDICFELTNRTERTLF